MLTEKMKKWFYAAQKEAMEELRKRFEDLPCNYQSFDSDNNRAIECYEAYNHPKDQAPEVKRIEVVYTHMEHGVTKIFIYEMKYIQGWELRDNEVKKGG